jgi:hypothetical protein
MVPVRALRAPQRDQRPTSGDSRRGAAASTRAGSRAGPGGRARGGRRQGAGRDAGRGDSGRDWWELNEEGTILRGERTGVTLRLGQQLDVRVARVEAVRGRVELAPAG